MTTQSFNPLYPMLIHKYEEFIPDQNASVIDKINAIIQTLNQVGTLTNDVVKDWNTVYQWCMNDGLQTDVNNKIDEELAKGTFDAILTSLFTPVVGDLTTLQTADKGNLVAAINDLQAEADSNKNLIGDLTTLTTTDKGNLVAAVNDNVASLAQKSKQYYVDVKKDFGAKGDGVTDDSAAIQNAINSLTSGGEVFFPQGTYLISQTLNININKMRLVGMGSLLSIIKTTAAITAIKVNGTSGTNIYWWSIENLCLEGNNVGTTGVDLEYAHEGFMKYCRVELFQTGVTTNQSWSNGFHSCQIMNNTNTNLVLGAQSNDNAIIDCQLDSAGVNGVHVTGQSQCISFVGCVIQSCGKEAMLFDAGSSINLSGCYFERNNNSNTTNISAINANGGSGSNVITGLNITGCQFWDNNTQAAINLNYVQGVFVGGSSLDIISGGTTAYSVISSVNTHYVTIAGCYKAQPLNDVGQCILSLGNNDTPSFNTNVKIKKASASFTLDTPDATTETYLNINKGGINYTCLYGETNGALYIQQRNSGGTLSNIVQFPAGASNGGRPTFYTGADFNNQNVVNANLIIPNGATASRPTPSAIGQMWFDTSLMKPIYCKQVSPAIWVDATGTTV